VQSLVGHQTLAMISRCLARLEAERDPGWAAAAAIGLQGPHPRVRSAQKCKIGTIRSSSPSDRLAPSSSSSA
jgi:hypothetical protein